MKRLIILSILLAFLTGLSFAADFGLLADQKIEADKKMFSYNPALTPWLSWNNGQGFSIYLSGLLSFRYIKYFDDTSGISGWSEPVFTPELLRFALNYRIDHGKSFEIGRFFYTDLLGFAASGLFDGMRLEMATSLGNIRSGIFYTGFLYKETAKIIMTDDDAINFAKPWDWDNFSDYFASRRVFAAIRWDLPLGETSFFSAEALAQFDLTGNNQKLNSQYGAIQVEFYPLSMLRMNLGALFETMQNANGDFNTAFGALAQLRTSLPTSANDSFGLTAKFTSGTWNDTFTAFTPISSVPQGIIFSNDISALAMVSANYSIRIINSLLAECALRYFMRTYNDSSPDGNLYGGELWASLAWQPLHDIRVTLGGGAFFPGLGNAHSAYGTNVMWKVNAGLSLSF
jgi:hypothetical protein